MNNTPLTPPHESEPQADMSEIQSAAMATEPGPSTATGPTIYQKLLPTLVGLAAEENYQDIINIAEQQELNADRQFDETRLLLITPLVLSYLILDELPSARHALARLPDMLHIHPIFHAISKTLLAVWEKNYAGIYLFAEELVSIVEEPEASTTAFPDLVRGLVRAFVDAFRSRTMALLAKAYVSLPLSAAQTYLGLPAELAIAAAHQTNWSYDPSTQAFTPFKSSQALTKPTGSTLSILDSMVEITARLENSM